MKGLNSLYSKQFGFWPKFNTVSATSYMATTEDIDKRQIGLAVFIDLKKAFDTINYELLIFIH